MNKGTLIWSILGCALLALGLTQCDMGVSTSSALTACDAGPDATCTPVTRAPSPPPSGW